MFSHRVWAIEELVHLICSHTLQDEGQAHRQKDGDLSILVPDPVSRQTLGRCAILNHSISRIATKVLWRELGSLKPLIALLPRDYYNPYGNVSCLCLCPH